MSDLYKRQNPHKLYRDKENAMLAGVCAYGGWAGAQVNGKVDK